MRSREWNKGQELLKVPSHRLVQDVWSSTAASAVHWLAGLSVGKAECLPFRYLLQLPAGGKCQILVTLMKYRLQMPGRDGHRADVKGKDGEMRETTTARAAASDGEKCEAR